MAVGLSRVQAARRAGMNRWTWTQIERGVPAASLRTLCSAADVVGLDLVLRMYPGRGTTLRDRGQLYLAERLCGLGHPSMSHELEVRAGDHGEAIDLVFWGPREILAVEIVRRVVDFQAQYRSMTLKRDWLARHHARPVRLILALEEARPNRQALIGHSQLIRSTMPGGTRQLIAALTTGRELGADALVWLRRRRTSAPA